MRDSASARAYHWTRERVLDGTFPGGTMLSEGEVSERVGVSRTPVREAFLRLAAEGVLQLFPKRGALVTSMSERDVRDVLEARLLVEPWAAAEAARQGDREDLVASLAQHVDHLRERGEAGDVVGYQEADRAFHEAIVTATGNALLIGFYRTLRDRQLRIGAVANSAVKGRAATILAEHLAIMRAIEKGDADGVGEMVRAHVETTRRALGVA